MREAFLPFEAEAILKILISQKLTTDFHFWRHEKNGFYSVRSDYYFHRKLLEVKRGHSSLSGAMKPYWEAVWNCKAEPKIKQFQWRLMSGYPPSLDNLTS